MIKVDLEKGQPRILRAIPHSLLRGCNSCDLTMWFLTAPTPLPALILIPEMLSSFGSSKKEIQRFPFQFSMLLKVTEFRSPLSPNFFERLRSLLAEVSSKWSPGLKNEASRPRYETNFDGIITESTITCTRRLPLLIERTT